MGKGIQSVDQMEGLLGPDPLSEALRGKIREMILTLAEAELREVLAAWPYERNGARRGYRNGKRERWIEVQRCTVHKLRNLERHTPRHALEQVKTDYHAIVNAKSLEQAKKAYREFVLKWKKLVPKAVASLEEAGEELLTFYGFPNSQSKSLRTTNAIERLNGEFRRRVKTQGSLPSAQAAELLLFGLIISGQIRMRRIDVIGGYVPNNPIDSIIVGYYDGGKLLYAGKVRNGFVPYTRRAVAAKFTGLKTDTCPFSNLPEKKRTQWALTAEEMKNCRWLKPELVAQIEFAEWTPTATCAIQDLSACGTIKTHRPLRAKKDPAALAHTSFAEY
jgi:hypothetical protein